MWWLLLAWIEGDIYTAHSVHSSIEQCTAEATVGDRCVAAELTVIDVPQPPEVTVSVLPAEGEMGIAQ